MQTGFARIPVIDQIQPAIFQRAAVRLDLSKSESVKRASILRADLDNHMILIMWSIGGIEGLSPFAAGHA